MFLYFIVDCRRGMLYKDLCSELLQEFQKAIIDFFVLLSSTLSISVASIHEEGYSVCLPLGQHSLYQLIQRLNLIANKTQLRQQQQLRLIQNSSLDPGLYASMPQKRPYSHAFRISQESLAYRKWLNM